MEESLLCCFDMFEVVQFECLRNRVFLSNDMQGARQMWSTVGKTKATPCLSEISLEEFISKILLFVEKISEDAKTLLLTKINHSSGDFGVLMT